VGGGRIVILETRSILLIRFWSLIDPWEER
jgi:hypothetical protein